MRNGFLCTVLMLFLTASSFAADCKSLPTASQLHQFLGTAPQTGGDAGGLFHGTLMWAAVVNRSSESRVKLRQVYIQRSQTWFKRPIARVSNKVSATLPKPAASLI